MPCYVMTCNGMTCYAMLWHDMMPYPRCHRRSNTHLRVFDGLLRQDRCHRRCLLLLLQRCPHDSGRHVRWTGKLHKRGARLGLVAMLKSFAGTSHHILGKHNSACYWIVVNKCCKWFLVDLRELTSLKYELNNQFSNTRGTLTDVDLKLRG